MSLVLFFRQKNKRTKDCYEAGFGKSLISLFDYVNLLQM